jgi:hypothetical protein
MSFCSLLLRRGGRLPLPNPLPLAGEGANVMPKPIDDRFGSMAKEEWQE